MSLFEERFERISKDHEALLSRSNEEVFSINGIFNRYKHPILTRDHVPLHWRFDMNPETNPRFMERIGFNAAFNAGAIKWQGRYVLAIRTEGNDRKSFFAIAESPNGVDNFRFWNRPITLPQNDVPDTNVYDMRLTKHDDGYVYGVFVPSEKIPMPPMEIPAVLWLRQVLHGPKISLTGSVCPILNPPADSNAMWCCFLISLMVNMDFIPVLKMASLIREKVVELASDWRMISSIRK